MKKKDWWKYEEKQKNKHDPVTEFIGVVCTIIYTLGEFSDA